MKEIIACLVDAAHHTTTEISGIQGGRASGAVIARCRFSFEQYDGAVPRQFVGDRSAGYTGTDNDKIMDHGLTGLPAAGATSREMNLPAKTKPRLRGVRAVGPSNPARNVLLKVRYREVVMLAVSLRLTRRGFQTFCKKTKIL